MMTARFSKTPTVLGAAMLPGQHTDEVLAELRTIGEPTTQR
jgi:hypothetical protein